MPRRRPLTISSLATRLGLSKATISKALSPLRDLPTSVGRRPDVRKHGHAERSATWPPVH